MFKDPVENAQKMLECYFGDHKGAMIELYNQARAYPNVPCRYFYDTAEIIRNDLLNKQQRT